MAMKSWFIFPGSQFEKNGDRLSNRPVEVVMGEWGFGTLEVPLLSQEMSIDRLKDFGFKEVWAWSTNNQIRIREGCFLSQFLY